MGDYRCALLFHRVSQLYERTGLIVTINLAFSNLDIAFGGVFNRAGPALKTGQIWPSQRFRIPSPSWKYKTSASSCKTTAFMLQHDFFIWTGESPTNETKA